MDSTHELSAHIHALLFAEGGGLTRTSLKHTLTCDDDALESALEALSAALAHSGLVLVRSDTEVALAISDTARGPILKKAAEESARDVGEAGLEVLAIVLYEGPSTRADIEYIRGVNSSTSIRNLLSRGLIERSGNPADAREFIYRPTVELLAHLGVEDRSMLPDYATISSELAHFKAGAQPASAAGESTHESGTTHRSA